MAWAIDGLPEIRADRFAVTLKRQLLLVSLLTLLLPWAGCRYIRETETALRNTQQQMLAGTATAIADSLGRYTDAFPVENHDATNPDNQLYAHGLAKPPVIDGYFEDWTLDADALSSMDDGDGPVRYVVGTYDGAAYIYVEVTDHDVVYSLAGHGAVDDTSGFSDRVLLSSVSPPLHSETFTFAAEAPGPITVFVNTANGFAPAPTISAFWQDTARGYQLEARLPLNLLGTHLGLIVENTSSKDAPGTRVASYSGEVPGALATMSKALSTIAKQLVQPGMRLIVTDSEGWRLANAGSINRTSVDREGGGWLRIAYEALIEPGNAAVLAEPAAHGREQLPYIQKALDGSRSVSWFRSPDNGRAIVAVAEPVLAGKREVGTVILQQGTDAILSLTNLGLARLMNVTLVATLLVAAALLGYASWLSRRIQRLSRAAENALDDDNLGASLPSAQAGDEIGDLSRSFSRVLRQLGEYNEYLRSLASKLSHELRTPLAIVSSSLENLEHENLGEAARQYSSRARDGSDRLRRILNAMSEATRVEELMAHPDFETFDLVGAVTSATQAYRDVYSDRLFEMDSDIDELPYTGSPELMIQMLDKLVDNAVDFSKPQDTVAISLRADTQTVTLAVDNPGPPLPETMRTQLFDPMVSVRTVSEQQHLGLGLHVARIIAEGHGGIIQAGNIDGGVRFSVTLPIRISLPDA